MSDRTYATTSSDQLINSYSPDIGLNQGMDLYEFDFNAFLAYRSIIAARNQKSCEGKDHCGYPTTVAEVDAVLTKFDPYKVAKVTFNAANIFSTTGGSKGSQWIKYDKITGTTSTDKTNHSTSKEVHAAVEVSFNAGFVSGSASVKGEHQWNFSDFKENSMKQIKKETTTQEIFFDEPCYLYQKSVTVTYMNGEEHTVYLGLY